MRGPGTEVRGAGEPRDIQRRAGAKHRETVHSITERRVLRLGDRGLKLTETASDLGLARRVGGDGLPAAVSTDLREMDAAIFTGQPLGRRDHQATRICR